MTAAFPQTTKENQQVLESYRITGKWAFAMKDGGSLNLVAALWLWHANRSNEFANRTTIASFHIRRYHPEAWLIEAKAPRRAPFAGSVR